MDISIIGTYVGIILSVGWTAYQEIRFQFGKIKQNIINNAFSTPQIK
jgi:hypothetical protein